VDLLEVVSFTAAVVVLENALQSTTVPIEALEAVALVLAVQVELMVLVAETLQPLAEHQVAAAVKETTFALAVVVLVVFVLLGSRFKEPYGTLCKNI
jgi:hypothetical protein